MSPAETGRRRRTLWAFLAAHSRWLTASMTSRVASSSGLPVSAEMSADSSPARDEMARLYSSSHSRPPRAPRLAHQRAAARARSTARPTSSGPATGYSPSTVPSRGSRLVNVGPVLLGSVVVIGDPLASDHIYLM